ncbi:hypothetical protein GCM10028784_18740 [Myceligenerans cantabricum]
MSTPTSRLEARIAELEAENRTLRERPGATRRRRAWRTALVASLIVVALLLTPVAAISTWARGQLVDTDRFVSTFAPLAQDPAVQEYLVDQVTAAIEEQADIPALTSDVFDGMRALDLPPRAAAALERLEGPAAQGFEALVERTVRRVVTSEQFADAWATALRASHREALALIQADPDGVLRLEAGGELTVQLGPVIEMVRERMVDQGLDFAASIPVVERSVPVADADGLVLARSVYALAVGVGTWLPWVLAALATAGCLLARQRSRALVVTAVGFAVMTGLLAAGIGVGRLYVVGSVSPSVLPADAAEALYTQVVEALRATAVAGVVLGLLTAVVAWFAGPSRGAVAFRGLAGSGIGAVRDAAARHGVTTGTFGVVLERWRGVVRTAIGVVAVVVVLATRPLETPTVVGVVAGSLVAVLLVELLRRPAGAAEVPGAAAPAGGEG